MQHVHRCINTYKATWMKWNNVRHGNENHFVNLLRSVDCFFSSYSCLRFYIQLTTKSLTIVAIHEGFVMNSQTRIVFMQFSLVLFIFVVKTESAHPSIACGIKYLQNILFPSDWCITYYWIHSSQTGCTVEHILIHVHFRLILF